MAVRARPGAAPGASPASHPPAAARPSAAPSSPPTVLRPTSIPSLAKISALPSTHICIASFEFSLLHLKQVSVYLLYTKKMDAADIW